jgi:Tol biopolymer transport system component
LWVGQINGGSEHLLRADWLMNPVWSPDGRWIAYVHLQETKAAIKTSIEVQPAVGGPAKTLMTDRMLSKRTLICNWFAEGSCLIWSPDWRVVFSSSTRLWVPAEDIGYSLWQVSTRRGIADLAGKPERLAHWADFGQGSLAVTADGKHLSFLKTKNWTDVYLAELGADKRKRLSPRRFTLDTRGNTPNAWTPDSQAILFTSDRTPRRAIFKQSVNSDIATPIISAVGRDCEGAESSPDGHWILYRESERVKPGASSAPVRLMRWPTAGGRSETVLEQPPEMDWDYGCGVKPPSSCILSQNEGSEVVLYTLDPMRGKGPPLGKIERPTWTNGAVWRISPDGSRLAFPTNNRRIRMLSLKDRTWTDEISLGPGCPIPQSVAWAADGKGLFVTCLSPDSFDLIYVSLTGAVSGLLHNGHRQWLIDPMSSPDGKYLAFRAQTWDNNIWVMENF